MKIAILGSAPHCIKAPFADESWEIWAPNFNNLPRISRWFQLHPDQDLAIYPGLLDWMKAQTFPIYTQEQRPDVPSSIAYPIKEMVAKYGTWFFTSSVAYMLALAIEEKPEEIGLWGVEMAHTDEYQRQRPGAHFFLQAARAAGIKLTVPEECRLLTDGRLYLFGRDDTTYAKLMAKKTELLGLQASVNVQKDQMTMTKLMLRGARDLRLPPDVIEAKLKEIDDQEPESNRALLTIGGALELVDEIENNWF